MQAYPSPLWVGTRPPTSRRSATSSTNSTKRAPTRRRMMVFSLHDRISGHAGRVRALDRFLAYARSKPDVWFARKDEIARYVLANRAGTPVIDRGPPGKTGLPGPTA